jgi:hypothetical protein
MAHPHRYYANILSGFERWLFYQLAMAISFGDKKLAMPSYSSTTTFKPAAASLSSYLEAGETIH